MFKQTLEKIENSKVFKNFKEKHPNAELCAGFFIIDFLSNDNKKSIDYKTENKIFTFDLNKNDEIFINEDKLIDNADYPKLMPIKPEAKIEINDLKGIVGIETLERGISAKIHKIVAVLQMHKEADEEKQIWNLTCMLENLIILHILVDAETGKVIKFERKSMMDMIRKK